MVEKSTSRRPECYEQCFWRSRKSTEAARNSLSNRWICFGWHRISDIISGVETGAVPTRDLSNVQEGGRVPPQSLRWWSLLLTYIPSLPRSTPIPTMHFSPSAAIATASTILHPNVHDHGHVFAARAEEELNCGQGGGNDSMFGLRVASVFVILVGSTSGALFPVVAKRSSWLHVPKSIFE